MIRILLVEDDAHKRAVIAEAILAVPGIGQDGLDVSTDAADAKRKLKDKGYNLLLLDINLPKRADKPPEPGGGLEVLRWLKGRGKEYRPPYIVGTTAYDASLQLAQTEFNNLIWTVIAFSFSDNAWRERLVATVSLILGEILPPYSNDGVTFRTDMLIVAALETPELQAVLSQPYGWNEAKVRFDDSRYFRAKVETDDLAFDVVCVAASDKGLSSAAITVTKGILAFRPQYVAMVGICAGVRGRVNIGDIVVADPSWDWGSGKTKVGTDGAQYFHPAQYQMRLDESLRSLAAELRSESQLLKAFHESFSGNRPDNAPLVHIGAFASGAAVLQSRTAVESILQYHKDLKAVDMEVYSLMYACHTAGVPRPKCIAAKAISDFGDDAKSDDYQDYAAAVSVSFLDELLRRLCKKS